MSNIFKNSNVRMRDRGKSSTMGGKKHAQCRKASKESCEHYEAYYKMFEEEAPEPILLSPKRLAAKYDGRSK